MICLRDESSKFGSSCSTGRSTADVLTEKLCVPQPFGVANVDRVPAVYKKLVEQEEFIFILLSM